MFNCLGDLHPSAHTRCNPPFLLHYSTMIYTNNKTNKQTKTLETSKNVLFKNNQLYWIELLEELKHDCLHVDHNQLNLCST